jgi:hypothetical protein
MVCIAKHRHLTYSNDLPNCIAEVSKFLAAYPAFRSSVERMPIVCFI